MRLRGSQEKEIEVEREREKEERSGQIVIIAESSGLMELDRPYAQLLRYRNELTTLLLNYARSPSPLSSTLSTLARERHRLSNVSLPSGFQRHPEGRGRRTREVLSWNIQPRDGMQTEESKRKPYDALEKVEGGSICLRALNALLEAGPRIYIHVYVYEKTVLCGCRKNCHCINARAFNSSGRVESGGGKERSTYGYSRRDNSSHLSRRFR